MGQNQSGRQVGFGAGRPGAGRPGAGQTHHQKPIPKQLQESQPPKSNSSSFETLVVTEESSINAEEAEETEEEKETVPYTSYSIAKSNEEEKKPVNVSQSKSHGIVVVGKKPQPSDTNQLHGSDVINKLDKIHIFYPILKSSCGQSNQSLSEEMKDGLEAPPMLNICLRYQKHLSGVACVIANAQMTLAARLKDLELFVVGIQQQLLRRQERLAHAAPHMQTVSEISEVLEMIQGQVDHCVPLMNRLNSLLPESDRMERFEVVDTSEYHDLGDAMNYSEQDNIIGFSYSNVDTDS